MRVVLLALLAGFIFAPIQASTLNGPFPESQPPDTFGACAGCTQLAYVSNPNITNSNGTFTATLNAAVYSDPSNTFCPGCLDFVYQVTNSGGSTDDIGRVTAFSYTGSQVDAGYSVAGEPADGGTAFPTGTWAPGLVDRNTADTVGFQFANVATAIPPGGTSVVLVIETDATSFAPGTASALDGGTANFHAFEPTSSASTPEPASAVMLGLGMVALAGLRRFRSQR